MRVRQNSRAQIALVEQRLGETPFFAGQELTGADIMMSFPFTTMQNFVRLDLANCPNVAAYVERIRQRPAWRRAMAVAEGQAPG
jgi:glutathione S-transferase